MKCEDEVKRRGAERGMMREKRDGPFTAREKLSECVTERDVRAREYRRREREEEQRPPLLF